MTDDADRESARARVSLAVTTIANEWLRMIADDPGHVAFLRSELPPALVEGIELVATAVAGADAPLQRDPVPGDVVQIDPESNPRFGACFGIVSEVRPWGVIANVIGPDSPKSSVYPVRSPKSSFVVVGRAEWVVGDEISKPEPTT